MYHTNMGKILGGIVAVLVAVVLFFGAVTIVETGERGVVLRLGSLQSTMNEGLNFKLPIVDNVKFMSIRDQTLNLKGDVSSSDIQTIQLETSLIYAYDEKEVGHIYQKYGQRIQSILIVPTISEITNAVVAAYPIEQFVEKRAEISQKILSAFTKKVQGSGLIVKSFLITNHDFAPEFEKSIEAKKIAEQMSLKAKYDLEKAKLDAAAQKEKQMSLTPLVLQEQFIQKWDGKLPQYIGTELPFILNKTVK